VTDSIAYWHAEHVNFGRLLGLLETQLDSFHRGDSPDYELMLDIMYYMTHYPDQIHHPKEDLAFARIVAREPGMRAAIDELLRQHEELRDSGAELVRVLDDVVNGSVVARDRVEDPARAYLAGFRGHVQKEESEVFPAAARVLTATDWTAINNAAGQRDDPLFGKTTERRYAALQRHLARQNG
jgi:hemerythrin-like domain-containing protein